MIWKRRRDMKIAMSGSTGFVGGHLTTAFRQKGWTIIPLVRDDFRGESAELSRKIGDAEVVINLAGASIASRWTEEYKKIMYSSRVETTKKIVDAIAAAEKKPGLFVSTSAVGIYDTGGVYSEENARYADDFLGKLALDWERTALRAKEMGVRTVIFRFGIVLSPDGGALKKMLIPFRIGLGGIIGDGSQAFSWVHIDDLIRAYLAVIDKKDFQGIYNLTSPRPTTNKGLTAALAHALHKPALMRVPSFVLKLQLGEGAEVLLKGQSVLPERLLNEGFTFRFVGIEEAIEDLLKKNG
jgi:uncharacterized protein (TIGR01777 family)